MSDVQPGWHDDGHGQLRWWDGSAWTDYVSPLPGSAPAPSTYVPATAQPKPRKGAPLWVWIVTGTAVVAISVIAIVVAVVAATGSRPLNEAEAVLHTYDSAWLNADCGLLEAATTEAFRADWGYEECRDFQAEAQEFGQADRDYHTTINSRVLEDGIVTIKTTESYDDEVPIVDHATYTIVKDGDVWRIDAIDFEGDGDETSKDA